MRNYCKTIGALAAVSALAASNASALDLDYNLHAGYTSEYIFRGVNQGQDLIEAGADVSADFGNGLSASAGAWYGSFNSPLDVFGINTNRSSDELDLYAKVSQDVGFATVSVGYIYYFYQQSDLSKALFPVDDAQEVTFGISREFYGVNVGLTYYWDIETDNDGYSELAASKSFELTSCLSLGVSSTLGYLVEEGHLSHLGAKVSLDYGFAEHATLSPFVAGTLDLSGGHGNYYGEAKNQLVGGVIVSVNF